MKYLLPDDADNFSDSHEECRAIASRILPRHKDLKREHSQVSCGMVGVRRLEPVDSTIADFPSRTFPGFRVKKSFLVQIMPATRASHL